MSRPLPRFTDHAIQHDPITAMIARREAEEAAARTKIAAGLWLAPDPADLRGIPCLARGTSSTVAGTDPLAETIERERIAALRKR